MALDYTLEEVTAITALATDPDVSWQTVKMVAGMVPAIKAKIARAQAGNPDRVITKAYIPQREAQLATDVNYKTLGRWVTEQDIIGFKCGIGNVAVGVDTSKPGSGFGISSKWWLNEGETLTPQALPDGVEVTNVVPLERCYDSMLLHDILSPLTKQSREIIPAAYKFLVSIVGMCGGLPDLTLDYKTAGKVVGLRTITGWKICQSLVEAKIMTKVDGKYQLQLALYDRGFHDAEWSPEVDDDEFACEVRENRDGWLAGKADPPADPDNPRHPDEDGLDWAPGLEPPVDQESRVLTMKVHGKVARTVFPWYRGHEDYSRHYWTEMKARIKQCLDDGLRIRSPLPSCL